MQVSRKAGYRVEPTLTVLQVTPGSSKGPPNTTKGFTVNGVPLASRKSWDLHASFRPNKIPLGNTGTRGKRYSGNMSRWVTDTLRNDSGGSPGCGNQEVQGNLLALAGWEQVSGIGNWGQWRDVTCLRPHSQVPSSGLPAHSAFVTLSRNCLLMYPTLLPGCKRPCSVCPATPTYGTGSVEGPVHVC